MDLAYARAGEGPRAAVILSDVPWEAHYARLYSVSKGTLVLKLEGALTDSLRSAVGNHLQVIIFSGGRRGTYKAKLLSAEGGRISVTAPRHLQISDDVRLGRRRCDLVIEFETESWPPGEPQGPKRAHVSGKGKCLDVSISGARLELPIGVAKGEMFHIRLRLGRSAPLDCWVQVMNGRDPDENGLYQGTVGVHFLDLDRLQESILTRFVRDRKAA